MDRRFTKNMWKSTSNWDTSNCKKRRWNGICWVKWSYLKFVEDAARLLYEELIKDNRIKDFIICSHQESLHSHDAVSVILAPESKFIVKFQ